MNVRLQEAINDLDKKHTKVLYSILFTGGSLLEIRNLVKKFHYEQENLLKENLPGYEIQPWFEDTRNSEVYQEWRLAVLQRDNWTCQNCKLVGGELDVHHIKSWKDFPELRITVNNGITLCVACHKEVHKCKK